LTLHFYHFLEERPKLKFYIPKDERGVISIGFATDFDTVDEYGQNVLSKNKYNFYQWVRITNLSDKPITISEFIVEFDNVKLSFNSTSYTERWCASKILNDKYKSHTSTARDPLLKPTITLSSYSVVEGYLFWGQSDSIPSENRKIKLTILSTRKTFVFKYKPRLNKPIIET
jgi:hypothetical protein